MKRLKILDIEDMPVGQGLESPLNLKRKSAPASPPYRPSPPEIKVEVECISLTEVPPPSPSLLSPAAGSPNKCSRPSPRRCQNQRHEDTFEQLNYGSEAGSGESDDEELASPFKIPRAYRSALETPIDVEHNTFHQPKVEPSPASAPAPATVPAEYTSIADVPTRATDQPWSLYDFDWKQFPDAPIPPESRREMFSHINVGPTARCVDPYDIFIAIWDRQFMEYIASETNRYARQLALLAASSFGKNKFHPNSRINKWQDTSADELYVYFGIIIAMGVVVKSRIEEYWNATPDVFFTPGFSAHMKGNRFTMLNKCLHFSNNEDMCTQRLDASEAKLYKVQPVLSHLNNKFQAMYRLRQNIALDESLLQWQGWLDSKQAIPSKAAAVGIKSYEICESQTGYLWRFEVHSCKKSSQQPFEDPLNASTQSIVLRLTHGLEGKGHTLWMDNFYNSPCLARRLKSLGFDCVGTLRTNRKFVPLDLHALTKENMRPGQIAGLTSEDVDVMVWRDINRVAMISTYHGNAVTQIRGATKPILIHDYNIVMGGVDKKDQMLAMYPIERNRARVWYKKLFRRLLNVSVLNAFIIHHQSSSSSHFLSHRNFRITLVKSLLSKHCSSTVQPETSQILRQQKPIDLTHRVAEHQFGNLNNKRQRLRRKCAMCKNLVKTFCVGCNKTVCIDPCFLALHK